MIGSHWFRIKNIRISEEGSLFSLVIDGISRLIKGLQVLVHFLVCRAQLLLYHASSRLTVARSRRHLLLKACGSTCSGRLPVLNHYTKPLLEVFLHTDTAALEQILNPLDLILQLFELAVLRLVRLLVLVDL